jgi:putative aldouronate transport system substrate-binding protein
MLCFSFCACASAIDESDENSAMPTSTEDTTILITQDNASDTRSSLAQNFPTYDEVQAEYPDKTILVWTIEEAMYDSSYPFRTSELNEYLNKKGYDFAVCFKVIRTRIGRETTNNYTNQINDMIQNGEQVDIVYSSYTAIEESIRNAYHKYIILNLFEPLDNYLQSGIGKELYDLMPAKHWEALRVNGHIYGIDGAMETLSYDYGYFVNAELADKYGFDISLPIEDQVEVLQEVRKNESSDLFSLYVQNLTMPSLFTNIFSISNAMYFDENNNVAKCILDNETFTNRIRFYNDLRKIGLLSNRGASGSQSFFILQDNIPGGSTIYKSGEAVDVDYNGNIIRAIPIFNEQTHVRCTFNATGVCSQSKNKNKAFDLLALTQTDPYLNNLLAYGLEGVDYNVTDGYADTIINPINVDRFANKMICHRSYRSKWTPQNYVDIFENAMLSESIGFAFDGRSVKDEIFATNNAVWNYTFLGNDDFDTEVENFHTELKALGIERMIDECNRQYQEYMNHEN